MYCNWFYKRKILYFHSQLLFTNPFLLCQQHPSQIKSLCFYIISGTGCSTAFIRVFAAMGIASDLQTMTSEAVKTGLIRAVDTNRPVVDCLTEAGREALENIPKDHYLTKDRYK